MNETPTGFATMAAIIVALFALIYLEGTSELLRIALWLVLLAEALHYWTDIFLYAGEDRVFLPRSRGWWAWFSLLDFGTAIGLLALGWYWTALLYGPGAYVYRLMQHAALKHFEPAEI